MSHESHSTSHARWRGLLRRVGIAAALASPLAAASALQADSVLTIEDPEALQQVLWGGREGVTMIDDPQQLASSVSLWDIEESHAVLTGEGAFTSMYELPLSEEYFSELDVSALATISLVAGLLDSPAVSSCPLVTLRISVTPELFPEHGWSVLLPVQIPETVDQAIKLVSQAAGDLLGIGPPQVQCLSQWVSKNGFQCCQVMTVYNGAQTACYWQTAQDMKDCMRDGLTAWAVCFFPCLGILAATGGLHLPVCADVCAKFGAAHFVLCWAGAFSGYKACMARAQAAATQQLMNQGCWPPPHGAFP